MKQQHIPYFTENLLRYFTIRKLQNQSSTALPLYYHHVKDALLMLSLEVLNIIHLDVETKFVRTKARSITGLLSKLLQHLKFGDKENNRK